MQNINNKEAGINYNHLLDLPFEDARKFLLKSKNYFSADLPSYFSFEKLIRSIDKELEGKNISDYFDRKNSPRDYDDINYALFNNKDGQYAWRQLKLIHPALYVSLVHQITKEENWKTIQERFQQFSSNTKIVCFSIPVKSLSSNSDKAAQVACWWEKVEKKSIELALEFDYLIQTDITDCYSSIYTHSIVWALHGKDVAKKAKKEHKDEMFLGSIIDRALQNMSHGQTNGIPEGSALMDFIAEIVLGYIDLQLSEKINEDKEIEDYKIIRYRDDYRIFINNQQNGKKILKLLTEILLGLGLKLNKNKTTTVSDQVISGSIKNDKWYCISQEVYNKNFLKHMMAIYILANQYNNSGSLKKKLDSYDKKLTKYSARRSAVLMPENTNFDDIPKKFTSGYVFYKNNKIIELFYYNKIENGDDALLKLDLRQELEGTDEQVGFDDFLHKIFEKSFEKLEVIQLFDNDFKKITLFTGHTRKNSTSKNIKQNEVISIVSILVDIAFKNPQTYHIAISILSKLLDFFDKNRQLEIIKKIQKRFEKIPHTEHFEIWLQRLTLKTELKVSYKNKLSKLVAKETGITIWNSDWLTDGSLKELINKCDIIDPEEIESLPSIIDNKEVSLFCSKFY